MSEKGAALRIAGAYTAIILGAGFASGQELGSFFVRFGRLGGPGLMAAGVMFAAVGWAVLELCRLEGVYSYRQLAVLTLGKWLAAVMEAVVGLFLFVLLATMLAAGGAAVKEAFGLPESLGVLALAVLCFITILLGIERMSAINAMLAPVMVAGGIFVGLYTILFEPVAAFSGLQSVPGGWLISAIVYASYNTVTAVTVLAAMGRQVTGPRVAFWGGTLGAAAMTVLGLCLAMPLFASQNALAFQIPLMNVVADYSVIIRAVYIIVLLAAIYTTAAANGAAFVEAARGVMPVNNALLTALVIACAVFASRIGFSTFVSKVYPLFGLFGFIQAVMILRAFIIAKAGRR